MSGGILFPGTAGTGDVVSGKTFTSQNGYNLVGSLAPIGTGLAGTPIPSGSQFQYSGTTSMLATPTQNGAPIAIATFSESATVSSITDTFSSHYSWSRVISASNSSDQEIWIGTGGAGSSGTVTVTYSSISVWVFSWAIPLIGCPGSVDTHTSNTGTSTSASISIAPNAAGELVIATIGTEANGPTQFSGPSSPWSVTSTGYENGTDGIEENFSLCIYQQAPASTLSPSFYLNGYSTQWQAVAVAFNHS